MKRLIKKFINHHAPTRRIINKFYSFIHRAPYTAQYEIDLTRELTVMAGPFRGMTYINQSHGSSLGTKLIGTYEAELHSYIYRLVELEPDQFIDIGCAEGYYAIGFKRLSPNTQCIAYDISSEARRMCKDLAQANAIEISINAEFQKSDFNKCNNKCTVIMADIEGFESELFTKESIHLTENTHFLIEYHSHKTDVTLQDFIRRFETSHIVEVIQNIPPKERPLRIKTPFFLDYQTMSTLLNERRRVDQMEWIYARPITSLNTTH